MSSPDPDERPRRRRARSRWAGVGALLLTFTTLSAGSAEATYGQGGMGFTNLYLQPVVSDSYWYGPIDVAAGRWNGSGAYTSIHRLTSGTSGGKVYAKIYPDSWYGFYTPYNEKCYNRTFQIQVNARTIVRDYPPSQHDAQNKRVLAHEMGHALSLAHGDPEPSIMNGDTYTYPTRNDVQDVISYNTTKPCQYGQVP